MDKNSEKFFLQETNKDLQCSHVIYFKKINNQSAKTAFFLKDESLTNMWPIRTDKSVNR